MSINTAINPTVTLIEQFKIDIEKSYRKAVGEARVELDKKQHVAVTKRLYGQNSTISKFQNIKANKDNAERFSEIIRLMDDYDKIAAENRDQIVTMGTERGFTEDESLCIYNMQAYGKAIDNIRSQKPQVVKILTGLD
jgi:pyruvate-formate lyase